MCLEFENEYSFTPSQPSGCVYVYVCVCVRMRGRGGGCGAKREIVSLVRG